MGMMRLVGFNLTKINAEKMLNDFSHLKVDTSINLNSVVENKAIPEKKDTTYLEIIFMYGINYLKKIAKIEITGRMVVAVDKKTGKEILKNWKKKEMDEKIRLDLFNGILMKANLKALHIEEELGLPPHFRLPVLTLPKKE